MPDSFKICAFTRPTGQPDEIPMTPEPCYSDRVRTIIPDLQAYKHQREQRYQENKKCLMLELDESRDLEFIGIEQDDRQISELALVSFKYREGIAKIQMEEQRRVQKQINQMKHQLNGHNQLKEEIESLKIQLASLRTSSSAASTTSPSNMAPSISSMSSDDPSTDGSDGGPSTTSYENEGSKDDPFWTPD